MGNKSVGVATKQSRSLSTRNRSSRVVVAAKHSKLVGQTLVIDSQRRNGPTSNQLAITEPALSIKISRNESVDKRKNWVRKICAASGLFFAMHRTHA